MNKTLVWILTISVISLGIYSVGMTRSREAYRGVAEYCVYEGDDC